MLKNMIKICDDVERLNDWVKGGFRIQDKQDGLEIGYEYNGTYFSLVKRLTYKQAHGILTAMNLVASDMMMCCGKEAAELLWERGCRVAEDGSGLGEVGVEA